MGTTCDTSLRATEIEEQKCAPFVEVTDKDFGQGTQADQTHRGLKSRHAQMIALGGMIGTGLFVGSGAALALGGPISLLVSYIILSVLVYLVVTAVTEIGAYLPVTGATMSYFGTRFVSDSLGFAMGWQYWYAFGIFVPYEITAASLVINFWPSDIHIAVWISVFIVVIVGLNFLPVKYYGETEFWFASLKVFMIIGLLMLSFILFCGGGPNKRVLAFHYWTHPGPVNTYLLSGSAGYTTAFFATLLISAFPFVFAPELLIVTAGEMKSPRRNLPVAAKLYFLRLVVFLVGGVLAVGLVCPSNDSRLTNGAAGAKSSPFVVAIQNAGISVLPDIINVVILSSAWSSGNSFLYLSSRTLYSLATAGNAPQIFKRCNQWGVPYVAVATSSLFTVLAYLNCASSSSVVFSWFVNLTNEAGFIAWVCCGIVYLRFRKACAAQQIHELPYRSRTQPLGAYIICGTFSIFALINGFTCFYPGRFSASSFLTAYLGIPIFATIYLGHRVWKYKDAWMIDPNLVDLHTGLREIELAEGPAPPRKGWRGKMLQLIW